MRRILAGLLLATLLLAPLAQAGHVPESKIRNACGGGGPNDCRIDPVGGSGVQSVGDPEFGDDWPGNGLPGSARVLGIQLGDDVRAYPVRMLNTHEIVNDVIDGQPVAVTFCPLCGSGVSFSRIVETGDGARETNFTASGFLYRTDMVMWDSTTKQLWNQITGQAIGELPDPDKSGRSDEHADQSLDLIPTSITTWSNWQQKHSSAQLLQPVFSASSYRENVYAVADASNCDHGISGTSSCDVDGLHPKVQVVTYDDGAGGIAFPALDVALEGAVFVRTTEGRGFVAASDIEGDSAIYDAGNHTFTPDDSGLWTDEDGGLWDLRRGARLDRAEQLDQMPATVLFWFAWHDHFPDTEVWLPEGREPITPPSRGIPGPSMVAFGLAMAAFAASTRKGL